MQINRRRFAVFAAGLGFGGIVELLSGWSCSAATVYADILAYVPVALNALASVLSILSGAGILATGDSILGVAVTTIKAGFADLQTAIEQYENAPAGTEATLLGKISEVLTILVTDLQQFWSDLDIPDSAIATLVEGLLGVILSTLMGFAAALPAPTQTAQLTQAQRRQATMLRKTISVAPQRRTVKQFRAEFNGMLAKAGDSQFGI